MAGRPARNVCLFIGEQRGGLAAVVVVVTKKGAGSFEAHNESPLAGHPKELQSVFKRDFNTPPKVGRSER